MAYNTKYILRYCNRDGTPLRVEIQLWDYVGEAFILVNEEDYLLDDDGRFVVTNIDGEYNPDRDQNPIEGTAYPLLITYQNDIGEKGGTMRATIAEMQFFENNVFNIDDLQTSDETEIRAVFYYDNELEWIGYVTPDFFNVPITANPYISLTASDRIGILKDITYPIEDFYTDARVSLMDIISKCLALTDLELNINTLVDFDCVQFDSAVGRDNHPFLDTYVSELRFITDQDTLETMSCYDVLKAICAQFNCLLTQYKGQWWIVNKEQLELGFGEIWSFDFEGGLLSIEDFEQRENTFSLIDTGGQRSIIPAGATNTYLLDHGDDVNYPENRTFIGDDSSINAWTDNLQYDMTRLVPLEYSSGGTAIINFTDVREWFLNIVSTPGNVGEIYPQGVSNQGDYVLQSKKFKPPTLDGKRMQFEIKVKAVGKPKTGIRLMLVLEFDDENYKYAALRYEINDDGTPNNEKPYFYFSKFAGDDNPPYNNISTGINQNTIPLIFDDKYNNELLASEQEWTIKVSAAAGVGQSGLDLTSAQMFVRVYPNVLVNSETNTQNMIKEITVDFTNDGQTPTGTVFQTKLDAKYTKPTETRKLLFGDYQTFGQNGFFYRYREDSLSIQYSVSGVKLKDWVTPMDSEINPLLLHSVRQLTKSYGQAHDELAIGFDMPRIDPFSKFAIKCFSEKYILVNPTNDYLQNGNGTYITSTIGKYLNSKRFILVEGTIDYLRSHFTGKLAQIRTNDVQHQEYIYSSFESEDIS